MTACPVERALRTVALLAASEAVTFFGAPLLLKHAGALENTALFEGFLAEVQLPHTVSATSEDKFAEWRSTVLSRLKDTSLVVRRSERDYAALETAFQKQKNGVTVEYMKNVPRAKYFCHSLPTKRDGEEYFALCFNEDSDAAGCAACDCSFLPSVSDLPFAPDDVVIEIIRPEAASSSSAMSTPNTADTPSPSKKKDTSTTDAALTHSSLALNILISTTALRARSNQCQTLQIVDRTYQRARARSALIGTGSVGAVNGRLSSGDAAVRLIQSEELRFNCDILEAVCDFEQLRGPGSTFRLVCIAGPSASNKTSFSYRLAEALQATGRSSVYLSLDDYYRPSTDPDYPLTPDGKKNHETPEALRISLFQQQVADILAGKKVETPVFDMKAEMPKEQGRIVHLPQSDGVLICEGLFALTPLLTAGDLIPASQVIKVFVLPLPTVVPTDLSFVSNQTIRTIRRVSRDFLFRGRGAAMTIARLKNLLRGEETTILPSLKYANFCYSTMLDTELNVLVPYSLPLLNKVSPREEDTFPMARRLGRFLSAFLPIANVATAVPPASLVREFIGGLCYEAEEEEEQERRKHLGDKDPGSPVFAGRCTQSVISVFDGMEADVADNTAAAAASVSAAAASNKKKDLRSLFGPIEISYDRTVTHLLTCRQKVFGALPAACVEPASKLGLNAADLINLGTNKRSSTGSSGIDSAEPLEHPIACVVDGQLLTLSAPVPCRGNAERLFDGGALPDDAIACCAGEQQQQRAAVTLPPIVRVVHPVYQSGVFGQQVVRATCFFTLSAAVFFVARKKNKHVAAVLLHSFGHGRRAERSVFEVVKVDREGANSCCDKIVSEMILAEEVQAKYNQLVARGAEIKILAASREQARNKLRDSNLCLSAALLEQQSSRNGNEILLASITDEDSSSGSGSNAQDGGAACFSGLLVEPLAPTTTVCKAQGRSFFLSRWNPEDDYNDKKHLYFLARDIRGDPTATKAAAQGTAAEELSVGDLLYDRTVREHRRLIESCADIRCVADINGLVSTPLYSKNSSPAAIIEKADRVCQSLNVGSLMTQIVRRITAERKTRVVLTGPRTGGRTHFAETLQTALASVGVRSKIVKPDETSGGSDVEDDAGSDAAEQAVSVTDLDNLGLSAAASKIVSIIDHDGKTAPHGGAGNTKKANSLLIFVAPLPLCNITEQLPVSSSDTRRVRKANQGNSNSPVLTNTGGLSTAAPSPSRHGAANQEVCHLEDDNHLVNVDSGTSDALAKEAEAALAAVRRRGSFFNIHQFTRMASDAASKLTTAETVGIDADVIAVDTAAVFEMTKSKHRVVQKLQLAHGHRGEAEELGLSQRVSVARVLRTLDFFLGV